MSSQMRKTGSTGSTGSTGACRTWQPVLAAVTTMRPPSCRVELLAAVSLTGQVRMCGGISVPGPAGPKSGPRCPGVTVFTNVDRQTLERRLSVALSNLIVDDWRLLITWTPTAGASGERAIAAALGWHIKSVMERSWDVDCEYNRTGTAHAAAVKRWRASNEDATDGPLPPTVTPDVIVHRRSLGGKANNLLVLELKKADGDDPPTGSTSRGSLKSILDIQKHFGYQHALLLNLRLTRQGPNPRWTWIEFADRNRVAHKPSQVYEAASLSALHHRGRLEDNRRYPRA